MDLLNVENYKDQKLNVAKKYSQQSLVPREVFIEVDDHLIIDSTD